MYCKYSQYVEKSVFEQFLNCSLTCDYCLKQKFCHQQNKVVHTDGWEECPRLVKKEEENAKSKKKQ